MLLQPGTYFHDLIVQKADIILSLFDAMFLDKVSDENITGVYLMYGGSDFINGGAEEEKAMN